ncbi:hypothetical protein vseg_010351 [Gypsophila vaccaria]
MAVTLLQVLEKLPFHILALVSILTFIILMYSKQNAKNQMPSPRKLPIIGNLHQLGTLPHRSLGSLSRKYGDLMLLHLGSKPTIVVSSADGAEEILKTHDAVFANRPDSKVASILFYDGKDIGFSKYGEYWRKVKSISVLHMLSNKKVQSFRKIREEEVYVMMEHIRKSPPSVPVNLSDIFTNFVNGVVSRVAFGRKYAEDEGCGNVKELLSDFVGALGAFTVGSFIPWLSWMDHVAGVLRKATKVAKALDIFLDKIVQEHLDRLNLRDQIGVAADKDDSAQDLVDVLLEIQMNDPSLERDNLKAILTDVIVAGVETNATLLEWAMSELLLHPEVMKKLQIEARAFTQGKAMIDEDDLKNMKYLGAVIKEALRLHPPAPLLLFREPSENAKICNYDIAVGTQVIINAWAIQRHPALWDDPEEFRPERFLKNEMDVTGHNFEFIPFGAGRRRCPGISFATANVELALANLVGRFDWMLPDEMQSDSFLAETFGTSVHKRDPLMAFPNFTG